MTRTHDPLIGAAAGLSAGIAVLVATTLRAPLFDPGQSPDASPLLVSSVPRLALALLVLAFSGSMGWFLGRRGHARLLTPFLPCGLAAVIFVPGAFGAAPFLASFGGRLLHLLLGVAILVSLGRLAGRFPPVSFPARTVALVGFLFHLLVGSWISAKVGLSGDEPHYLLITYSLVHDHDLEVQNNYGAEAHRSFYAGRIEPRLAGGTPYPVHGIGVPLLLVPGFAAFGLTGVLLTEALMAAFLLRAIYQASMRLTKGASPAVVAVAAFGLTSPALFLSTSAYPELPAALFVACIAVRLLEPGAMSAGSAFGWALLAGALPFLHVKFLPLAGVCIGVLASRPRRGRSLAPVILGACVSLGAFLLLQFLTVGSLDPTAGYGRRRIFLERVPLGIAGLLFDQEYGLLLHAPVYLLGFAGIPAAFRRSRIFGGLAVLVFLSVAIPGAAHPLWTGGTSPPARFLFPALPVLAIAVAALLSHERELGVGPWAPWALAGSVGIGLSMLFLPGGPFFLNARTGTGRIWEALSTSWNLADYLPSLVRADARSIAFAAALGILLVAAIAAHALRARAFRVFPLALAILFAAWLQDRTRVPRTRDLEPHWVSSIMHRLAFSEGHQTFLLLPSGEPLTKDALAARVSLPLEAFPDDGDPRYWWSRAYSLPAGRFLLAGVPSMGTTFFNGDSAIQSDDLAVSSTVALDRFRVRARRVLAPPRLSLVEARPSSRVALASLAIPGGGLRLHALDEEAYADPAGFWVRKGSRASFAVELEEPTGGATKVLLRIANGGARNHVVLRSDSVNETYVLEPFEEREAALGGKGPLLDFSIESESGFRPRLIDRRTRDDRELGVFVAARASF